MAEDNASNLPVFNSVEEILVFLKPYGVFQKIITFMLGITYMAGFHGVSAYFTNKDPSWKCVFNSSVCQYNNTRHLSDNMVCNLPRSEWVYSKPLDYSIISQFDLICNRQWLAHLATSVHYIGWGIGSITLGKLSDIYGRRIIVIPTTALLLVITIILAFSPNVYMFIACRFVIGILTGGLSPVLLILMGEMVDSKNRPFLMAVLYIAYSIGLILLGITGYFIQQWKWLLITYTSPLLIIVAFYKFVPESIHWLHLNGTKEELNTIFKRMAYWNKKKIPDDISATLPTPESFSEESRMLDLFRPCAVASRTFNLSYGWFAIVMMYFGISLAADDLGGSMYVNFILACAIEIPANILSIYTNTKFGRKMTVTLCFFAGSVSCITVAFIPSNSIGRLIVGLAGKACSTIAFNYMYMWSIEIYPTNVRGSAMGVFTVIGRIGGGTSPWIARGLRSVDPKAPFITMGALGVVGASLFVLLPETKEIPIRETGHDFNSDNAINDMEPMNTEKQQKFDNGECDSVVQSDDNLGSRKETVPKIVYKRRRSEPKSILTNTGYPTIKKITNAEDLFKLDYKEMEYKIVYQRRKSEPRNIHKRKKSEPFELDNDFQSNNLLDIPEEMEVANILKRQINEPVDIYKRRRSEPKNIHKPQRSKFLEYV